VQLLARNLGIPNAVVPSTAIPRLKQSNGREVFFAISPQGSVVLQDADKMDDVAKMILAEKSTGQKATLITIDVPKLQLDDKRLLSLDELTTDDVGRKVGPKAGNLSRLRYHFKDRVAQGVTLPFGIFKDYLEQPANDGAPTIMEDIRTTWAKVAEMKSARAHADSIDKYVDRRLEMIRKRITTGTLQPWLVAELEKRLAAEFGPFGTWGTFIRSDTNVEDLPGFTGAGLNLTVFNKTTFADIQQGIKDVWASVFSKRSYGWRQSVMDKPEHVYASVLLQKSVPNDKSGVLVTANIETGNMDEFTVACSEGPGGAVSGESAEQLLLRRDGSYKFVQQAKAPYRTLLKFDAKGGSMQTPASGRSRILEDAEITQLVQLEKELKTAYPNNMDDLGRPIPWDVEFGFLNGKLMLFQIRQVNENRALKSLRSLSRLDAGVEFKKDNAVDLNQKPGATS
jgi:phosphoenolpyruvate synthase/pyruvate phosphate dikinase